MQMSMITSFLSESIQPIALLWLCCLLSWFRAFWHQHRKSAFAFFVISLLFFVIGSTPLSARLAHRLEAAYILESWNAVPNADALVVLGAGLIPSNNDLNRFNLKRETDRIITAFELVRRGKTKALVFGGGRMGEGMLSEGEHLQMWFNNWKIAKTKTFILPDSQNTHDEALATKSLADKRNWNSILLVTSATHMARAEATFRATGLNVIPIACDFEGSSHLQCFGGWHLFPQLSNFNLMQSYLHEVVGWIYYDYRGWISDPRTFLW